MPNSNATHKVVKVGTEDWPKSQQRSEIGSAHVLRWNFEWGDRNGPIRKSQSLPLDLILRQCAV